jgi:hypothetical protein
MITLPPKLFVLDTNVILHDSGCIQKFEENDVAIPITVLEELDQFKRGNEDIHFQAREFLRRLDALTGDLLSLDGSPLGDGLGSIRVVIGGGAEDRLRDAFLQDSPDHRILGTTLLLQRQVAPRQVVLVSKDTNLRMKAKSLGIRAQDYTSDKVKGSDGLYTGRRTVEGIESDVIDGFYVRGGVVPAVSQSLQDLVSAVGSSLPPPPLSWSFAFTSCPLSRRSGHSPCVCRSCLDVAKRRSFGSSTIWSAADTASCSSRRGVCMSVISARQTARSSTTNRCRPAPKRSCSLAVSCGWADCPSRLSIRRRKPPTRRLPSSPLATPMGLVRTRAVWRRTASR